MNLIKKLAIPAIILPAISGNMCFGSEFGAKTLDPSLSKSDRIRMEDFLPHTFWCQSAKDIIAYLKPQILETKAFDCFCYSDDYSVFFILQEPWIGENRFKALIYDRISEFMEDKSELMPKFKEFNTSFDKHPLPSFNVFGKSNLMAWLVDYLRPIAYEVYNRKTLEKGPWQKLKRKILDLCI